MKEEKKCGLRRAGKGSHRRTAVRPEDGRLEKSRSQGKEENKKKMPQNVSHNGELERTGNVIKEKNNAGKTKNAIRDFYEN